MQASVGPALWISRPLYWKQTAIREAFLCSTVPADR